MLTVKFGDDKYEYDLDEQLRSLTGLESADVEEFLGGWKKFRSGTSTVRSMIVFIWLGQRAAGKQTSLEEIAATPGLMFGDMVDISDDGDEPEDPKKDAGRPLAETNGSNGSEDGSTASELSLVTSGPSGGPRSDGSTG